MGMKLLGGFLIALAIFWACIIVADISASFMHPGTRFVFNWPDFWKIAGYLVVPIAMLVLGIMVWRWKPKN
jgi:hypothetical protein